MRTLLLALPLLLLAACSDEPENIQAKADNISRALEDEADRIDAEAAGNANAVAAPLDNQAEVLLNQAAANAAAAPEANASGNAN